MADLWIPVRDIPRSGREYVLEKQEYWTDPLAEFSIPCRIEFPLRAHLFVLPQDDGALVQGTLRGVVFLPCDRCMEDARFEVQHTFESFEPFPPLYGEETTDGGDVDAEVVRLTRDRRGVEMNLAALAWEEFSLLLPTKPLCDPACKGLCRNCGTNLNHMVCACVADAGDPRLAPLRGLTVNR